MPPDQTRETEEFYHSLYTMTRNLATLLRTQADSLDQQSETFHRLWRAEQLKNDPARRGAESGQAH